MFAELSNWILSLDRQFAFLLVLPFVVAITGLLSDSVTQRRSSHGRDRRSTTTRHNTPSFSR